MSAYVGEWLNLVVRWAHVTAAIMWVGDSFLFAWLDSALEPPEAGRGPGAVGQIWLTHSGGFYEIVRHRSLPALPARMHWFEWESYTTGITGVALLAIVLGAGSRATLVDAAGPLSHAVALALAFGLVAFAPLVYALLCAIPGLRGGRLGVTALALVTALSAFLVRVVTPRAAFLLVGAALGAVMVANVFFVIIPAQRRLVAAIRDGRPIDAGLGERAKGRSTHNHYLTLPVLFAMLSNHFPSLWGGPHAWLVLPLLLAAGAGVKLAMSRRARTPAWAGAGTLACLGAVAALTLPPGPGAAERALASHAPVSDAQARLLVQRRCVTCHATHPGNAAFTAPPNGVTFETTDQMRAYADRIVFRVVATRTMPLGNLTGMTDDERSTLGAWAWRQAHP